MEQYPIKTPIEAEVKALRIGLLQVIQHNFSPLQINIDDEELVRIFQTNNLLHGNIIFDCRSLLNRLEHVFYEQNQVANAMAKEGIRSGNL